MPEIPFLCISRETKNNKITKEVLINILKCYKGSIGSNDGKDNFSASTPIKRINADSNIPPFDKRCKLEDNISDTSSLFEGLLNTPEKGYN